MSIPFLKFFEIFINSNSTKYVLYSQYLSCIKTMSFNSSTYMVKQHNKRLIWGARQTFHVYWSDLDMFGKWPPIYAYICLLFVFLKFFKQNSILFHSLTNYLDGPITKVVPCLSFYWLSFLLFQISTTSLSKYLILSTNIRVTNILNKLLLFLKS